MRKVIVDAAAEASPIVDAAGKPILYCFFAPVPDPMRFRKAWVMILTLAVRDDATSVEYSLCRLPVGNLWYVVAGTRYEMVPLPDEYAPDIVEAARVLAMPGRWAALRWRLSGLFGSRAAAGMFGFSINGNVSWWVAGV